MPLPPLSELDRLLLAQADVALVLVDPAQGRVVHANPVWAEWLGQSPEAVQAGPFWAEALWCQPQVLQTLLALSVLPLPLPALPVMARTAQGQDLPLRLSLKPVQHAGRRHALCTLCMDLADRVDPHPAQTGQALQAVVQTLSAVLERHDPASVGHQRRVADLAATLARKLGWPPSEVACVEIAASLHDLGMVAVPAATLAKRDLLTTEEVRQIQQHVQTGVRMLEHIDFSGPVGELIAQHHERLNGSGYPAGLRAGAILRGAQLIGMADMLDAMTRERPYQPAQPLAQALGTLLAGAGILFDADLVQACVALFELDGYRFPAV